MWLFSLDKQMKKKNPLFFGNFRPSLLYLMISLSVESENFNFLIFFLWLEVLPIADFVIISLLGIICKLVWRDPTPPH